MTGVFRVISWSGSEPGALAGPARRRPSMAKPANIAATSLLSAGWPHEHRCGIDVVGGAPDSRGGCGGAGGGTYFGADAGQMSVIMKARSPRVRPARPPARPGRWPG